MHISKAAKSEQVKEISNDLPWSERMARSVMKRNPESWMTDFRKTPRWSYTHGLVLMAIQKVWENTGDEAYYRYAKAYADKMINEDGEIYGYHIDEYNIDHINPGKILFPIYERTKDARYKKALMTLRRQLHWHPRTTEGGYWHKLKYTWQMWLDGIYMGSPFYAQYGKVFNEPGNYDDVINQILLMEKHSRDPRSGLLYHGWDESRVQSWSDPETGCSPEFWGRAMGWYGMALVDVLDFIPEDHEKRGEVIAVLERFAKAVAKVQDRETGLWYQVLDKPEKDGNYQEATVSCMFVYTLAKAVNNGYLESTYAPIAMQGFDGIIENLVEVEKNGEVHIHQCCAVAGLGGRPYRDGTFQYYISEEVRSNDTKATGPFILAALEFENGSTRWVH